MNWQPTASLSMLQQNARLRRTLRDWMTLHDILEVSTPVLSRHAATDPHVHSMVATEFTGDDRWFLQSSPEFPMKRLLAAHWQASLGAGSTESAPDIYQIAPVFRAAEIGRRHNTEFTLLEWYRHGMDHVALMADVESLLRSVWETFGRTWLPARQIAYGAQVKAILGTWPEETPVSRVADHFARAGRDFPKSLGDDCDAALDLFMDEFILPEFPTDRITFLTDYPASQAALSRIGHDSNGRRVAQRFEVYLGRSELGNGFHELADAAEQRQRFEADLLTRRQRGMDNVPIDTYLLDALTAGLPDCAGIAMGLERLLMALTDAEHIRDVLSFDTVRA